MKPGDPFNPRRMFTGIFMPDWLLRMELTPGAKMVWARGASFADDAGRCWFKQDDMAGALGMSDRTVRRAVEQLVAAQLLQVEKASGQERLMHHSDSYIYVWHEAMDEALRPADEMSAPGRTEGPAQGGRSDRPDVVGNPSETPPAASQPGPPGQMEREIKAEGDLADWITALLEQFAAHLIDQGFTKDAKKMLAAARGEDQVAARRELRLLIAKDQVAPEHIAKCIRWLGEPGRNSRFWAGNIRHPRKLRERWEQLLHAAREQKENGRSHVADVAGHNARLRQLAQEAQRQQESAA